MVAVLPVGEALGWQALLHKSIDWRRPSALALFDESQMIAFEIVWLLL